MYEPLSGIRRETPMHAPSPPFQEQENVYFSDYLSKIILVPPQEIVERDSAAMIMTAARVGSNLALWTFDLQE